MYKVYQAETVDEAIEMGLKDLNVTEDDIKIDVIEAGKRGIFGLGKKNAEVKLTVINPELKMYESLDALKFRHTRFEKEANITDNNTVAETNVTEEEARDEVAEEEINEEPFEKTPVITEESKFTFLDAAESTMNYVHSIITEMGIKNNVTYTIEDKEINIEIESDYASKIIGKRGATLNAIQEIAQSYFNRIYTSYGRVIIDTENYRMKREETLETLALNMTKKALQTGLPVHLEPMPANERKIIHNALSNVTNIKTHSEGEEPNRYLVIQKK